MMTNKKLSYMIAGSLALAAIGFVGVRSVRMGAPDATQGQIGQRSEPRTEVDVNNLLMRSTGDVTTKVEFDSRPDDTEPDQDYGHRTKGYGHP